MSKYVQEPWTWLALGMPSKWKHQSTRREPKIVLKCHLLQKFQTKGHPPPTYPPFKKITNAKPSWKRRRWLTRQLLPNLLGSLWLNWTVCSPSSPCTERGAAPASRTYLDIPKGLCSWVAVVPWTRQAGGASLVSRLRSKDKKALKKNKKNPRIVGWDLRSVWGS